MTALLPGSRALGNVQSLIIVTLESRQLLASARQLCANDELNSHRRDCLNVQTTRERNRSNSVLELDLGRARQQNHGRLRSHSLFGASLSYYQTRRQL